MRLGDFNSFMFFRKLLADFNSFMFFRRFSYTNSDEKIAKEPKLEID